MDKTETAACRACEISANDEQVKQMPMHTCGKDGPVEVARPKTETKEMEGKLKSLHHKLYDQIVMIPNGVKFLVAVNEGIEELKSLRSELSKAKELNGELVGYLKRIMTREIFKEHFNIEQVEELIKKSES